jgi:very-short-patch-repair endonuclease
MPTETSFDQNISGQPSFRSFDRWIAGIAERQHGVVARDQLLSAGVRAHVIDHGLKLGRLHALHQGVYAVGHRRLTREGRWLAAVLAGGEGAVLSHRSAAALWGFGAAVHLDVTAPDTHRVRPGIQIHSSRLPPDEVTVERAIPLTTVPRTILDLAAVVQADQVERAINEAEFRRLTDPLSLADLVARYPGRRGIRTIKAILYRLRDGATITRSELESRFLAFLRTTGLPLPSLNTWLRLGARSIECDCVWRVQRLVVELDGHAAHHTTAAFERDRARDRALNARGWRTVRVTWRQLHQEPEALAVDLRKLLPAGR